MSPTYAPEPITTKKRSFSIDRVNKGCVLDRHYCMIKALEISTDLSSLFANSKSEHDKLIGEGMTRFFYCLKNYDNQRSSDFLTYARWWIKYGIWKKSQEQSK